VTPHIFYGAIQNGIKNYIILYPQKKPQKRKMEVAACATWEVIMMMKTNKKENKI
jgi:hypothetical protein